MAVRRQPDEYRKEEDGAAVKDVTRSGLGKALCHPVFLSLGLDPLRSPGLPFARACDVAGWSPFKESEKLFFAFLQTRWQFA